MTELSEAFQAEYAVFSSEDYKTELTDVQLDNVETFACMWGSDDESATDFIDNFFTQAGMFCTDLPDMRAWREEHGGQIPIEVRCAAGVVMRELGFNVRLSEQVDRIQGGFISYGRRVDGSEPTAPFLGGARG